MSKLIKRVFDVVSRQSIQGATVYGKGFIETTDGFGVVETPDNSPGNIITVKALNYSINRFIVSDEIGLEPLVQAIYGKWKLYKITEEVDPNIDNTPIKIIPINHTNMELRIFNPDGTYVFIKNNNTNNYLWKSNLIIDNNNDLIIDVKIYIYKNDSDFVQNNPGHAPKEHTFKINFDESFLLREVKEGQYLRKYYYKIIQ
ncbi:MAG TPA: hypothetical protein PK771_03005 [Spirochaetota bacterium]|nr:hypothetical protein [Spirochaetota bacterium]